MKISAVLRLVIVVALMSISSSAIFAQVTGTGSLVAKGAVAGEEADYVTKNSVMPYEVTPFDWGTWAGTVMNNSIFKWSLTSGTAGTDWSLFQSDGSTPLTEISGKPGYYSQNAISIKWSKEDTYTINVTERSQPKFGDLNGCEQSTPENLTVHVLPWPKADFGTNSDPSACGLSSVTLNLACTGSQSITVSYDVYFTAMATGSTRTKITTSPVDVTLTNSGYNIPAPGSLTYSVGNGAGKYEIVLVNVKDKITEKSFGSLATNAPARNATASDLATAPFVFYSFPTPTTQPIQHIKNL